MDDEGPVNEKVDTKKFKGDKHLLGTIEKDDYEGKERVVEKDV